MCVSVVRCFSLRFALEFPLTAGPNPLCLRVNTPGTLVGAFVWVITNASSLHTIQTYDKIMDVAFPNIDTALSSFFFCLFKLYTFNKAATLTC